MPFLISFAEIAMSKTPYQYSDKCKTNSVIKTGQNVKSRGFFERQWRWFFAFFWIFLLQHCVNADDLVDPFLGFGVIRLLFKNTPVIAECGRVLSGFGQSNAAFEICFGEGFLSRFV